MRKYIKTLLQESTSTFSPIDALKRVAEWCNSFDEFEKHYLHNINHGYFWHFTSDPKFQYSQAIGSRDMSAMADGEASELGSFMVTSDFDNWNEYYNEDKQTPERPYVALIDLSYIDPKYVRQVSRGFGNEIYLPPVHASKAQVIGVYPRTTAMRIDRKYHRMIPQSESELEDLYNGVKNQ